MRSARWTLATRLEAMALLAVLHTQGIAATVTADPLDTEGRTITVQDADPGALEAIRRRHLPGSDQPA